MDPFPIPYMDTRRVLFNAIINGEDIRPEGIYSSKASRRFFKELATKAQKHYRQRSVLEMADGYVLQILLLYYAQAEMAGEKFNPDEELCARIDVALLPFFAPTGIRKEVDIPDTISFAPDFNLVKAVVNSQPELLDLFDAHKTESFDFMWSHAIYMEIPDVMTAEPKNADECVFRLVIFSVPSACKDESMLIVVRCIAGTNMIVGWAASNAGNHGTLRHLGYDNHDDAMRDFNVGFGVLSTSVALHLEKLRIQDELALIPPVRPEEVPSKGKSRRRKPRRAPVIVETTDPFDAMHLTADHLFRHADYQPAIIPEDDRPDFTADLAAIRAPDPEVEAEADDGLIDAEVVDDDGNLVIEPDGTLRNSKSGKKYKTPIAAYWRRQPWGPHNSLRRMQVIRRFCKGPPDAPMKTGVYAHALDDAYIPPMPVFGAKRPTKTRRRKLALQECAA